MVQRMLTVLNHGKTKAILFHTNSSHTDHSDLIHNNETPFEMVPHFETLGMDFDQKLKWKHHVDVVSMHKHSKP